jgi:PRC-barrel domain/Domain of unknown function (DUF2382)
MPTPSIETVGGWLDRALIDSDGDKIGEITDIYLDGETDRPDWAVVRTGLFGMRSTFVPLAGATEAGDQIHVPYQKAQVKTAPNIEADGQLSEAEEAELYRHYGLDYDTVTTATHPGELASTPAEGPPSAGIVGEPGTPAREPGSAANNQNPDGGFVQGGRARQEGRDDELSASGVTGSSQPPREDASATSGSASQPFVYETPGRPGRDDGTRRRQPGQVRLRRYLVTEVVTETASGQRHEVRVEREPISDTDVDAGADTSNQDTQPSGRGPTEADDDWFGEEGDVRR